MNKQDLLPRLCVSIWKYAIVLLLFAFNVQDAKAQDTIPIVNPINNIYVENGDVVSAITFTGTAEIYHWFANGSAIGMTTTSGVNTIPAFTAINNGWGPIYTTINVVPMRVNNGMDTIPGTPMLFTIHVTGDSLNWNDSTDWRDTILPYVNPVNDKYVFHGNTVPSIIFSGDADSYTWTATGDNIGMTANSGTNTVPSFTAINTGYTTLRTTFTVTPVKSILGNTVTGTPMLFSIHVTGDSLNWNDSTDWRDTILPYVNPVNDKYVFHGNTVPSIVFSGDADSYTWTATGDNIGMAANSGTNTVPSFTAINTGGLMLRAAITVTPVKSISGNTITGTPMLFSIHVTGDSLNWNDSTDWRDTILPYVNPVNDKYVFHGNTVPSIIFNGDADSYTWTATGDNIGMSANSGTNIVPSFTAINTGYTTLMATFAVTPVKNNINGTPMSFSIYVSPHDQDSIPGTIPVQGISVYPKSITISIGQWQNLFVFVSPYNASNRAYNYYINDPQIVSLDTAMSFYDSVFIQGLTPGTTFIVFETIEGGFRDTCWVTVINTNTHTSISGTIYLKDTVIVPSGLVFLYKETNAVYQFVDSTIIDNNGNYIFAGVRQGNYLVQALTNIPGTLPTYYGNTTVWSSASVIRVNNNNPVTGINIIVVGFDSLRGSGTISGYVGNDGKNTKSTLHKSSVADPYVDATVFLQRKENDAAHTIAITYTDKNGFFEFNHVPVGHYIIVVDIPGLDMIDNNEIDITEDGQVIENQNYIITEEGIEAEHKGATSIEQLSTEIEINLYPNPAQNVLHIQSSSVVEQITIYDINGRMIKQILFPNQDINVNDLAKGIYLVKVKTEAGDVLRKVIKE